MCRPKQRQMCFAFVVAISLSSGSLAYSQTLDQFHSMPGIVRTFLGFPGVAQIYLGQPEGYVYAGIGMPTLAAGVGLLSWYLAGNKTDADLWKLNAGLLSSEIGASFSGYSMWAYLRDYEDANGFSGPRTGRESYLQLLGAPYDPKVVFDYRALPVVGLELFAFLGPDAISNMGNYFHLDTATFSGVSLPTGTALALEAGYALTVNLFVAVAEETIFRGIILDKLGPLWTALIFGAVHSTNILLSRSIDRLTIERMILQTLSATVAGFYLSMVTQKNGYDLRPAIAYHYWHNVLAMISNFLYENGKPSATTSTTPTRSNLRFGLGPGPSLSVSVPLW